MRLATSSEFSSMPLKLKETNVSDKNNDRRQTVGYLRAGTLV